MRPLKRINLSDKWHFILFYFDSRKSPWLPLFFFRWRPCLAKWLYNQITTVSAKLSTMVSSSVLELLILFESSSEKWLMQLAKLSDLCLSKKVPFQILTSSILSTFIGSSCSPFLLNKNKLLKACYSFTFKFILRLRYKFAHWRFVKKKK